jgi:tetratricopeptide (TPR) repeat protein
VTSEAGSAPEAISLLGDSLYSAPPSAALLERYEARRADYLLDSTDLENLIWYGRFTAYLGNYREAIAIYSRGLERWPDEPRLYRHRGHRYLTIRRLDDAITDLERAATLIEGTPNAMEQDGMPNAQGIPVSSQHGNIWYHLGLAYYLKGDMDNALRAYTHCLQTSDQADNVVSATHWLYMIQRRRGDTVAAQAVLEPIEPDMDVIENVGYHRACLFYKGLLSEEELLAEKDDAPAADAVRYALANWYAYEGDSAQAGAHLRALLAEGGWNSFGYLAAEADMARE